MASARLMDILKAKRLVWSLPGLIAVSPDDTLVRAIHLLHVHSISQLPVLRGGKAVGRVEDRTILDAIHRRVNLHRARIADIMEEPLPHLSGGATYADAFQLLDKHPAILVVDPQGLAAGIVTQSDLLALWLYPESEEYAI
jgi:cystathionine beta-synthase